MRYKRETRSPYHKYGKRPFVYGENYHRWKAAVEAHGLDSDEALTADAAFRRQFGIPQRRITERFIGA